MKEELKLNVLIYGPGAREHALAWKIAQSPLLNELFLALPNDGFKELGKEITFVDFEDLSIQCKKNNIDIVIIGSEEPLSQGIIDTLKNHKINCIGTDKYWSQLESSKSFAKNFMQKNHIQTAKYIVIENFAQAENALAQFNPPFVIKADGLCKGKGVVIADTKEEAILTIESFLEGKYEEASKKIVVEEFIEGREISVFSLWDSKNLLSFAPCCDYKKLLANNKGPNTGGMGSYCPVNLNETEIKMFKDYEKLLETALKNEKVDFKGIIYSGLILTDEGIKVLEYNVRFGDPEVQSLLIHLKTDILEIFKSTIEQKLNNQKIEYTQKKSICVVLASKGYPDNPETGKLITNIEKIPANVQIFYAGIQNTNNNLLTNGGRVLSICSNSLDDVYKSALTIDFEGKIYRTDIAT